MDRRCPRGVPVMKYRELAKKHADQMEKHQFAKACQSYRTTVTDLKAGTIRLVNVKNSETGEQRHSVQDESSRLGRVPYKK